jgi:hypothetical protein
MKNEDDETFYNNRKKEVRVVSCASVALQIVYQLGVVV